MYIGEEASPIGPYVLKRSVTERGCQQSMLRSGAPDRNESIDAPASQRVRRRANCRTSFARQIISVVKSEMVETGGIGGRESIKGQAPI